MVFSQQISTQHDRYGSWILMSYIVLAISNIKTPNENPSFTEYVDTIT